MFDVSSLKRSDPRELERPSTNSSKVVLAGHTRLFYLHCRFQINSLRSCGIDERFLSSDHFKIIAHVAYALLFSPKPIEPREYRVEPSLSFLRSITYWNPSCISFNTTTILGRGFQKTVFDSLRIEIDPSVGPSSVKISPVAFVIVQGNKEEIIREDNLAKRFTSPYIVKSSMQKIESASGYLFLQNKLTGDFLKVVQNVMKLSFSEALLCMKGVARGLSLMHDEGILHRDIKPANSGILEIYGQIKRGVLLDLGFGAEFDQVGSVVLSAIYAAPELAQKELSVGSRFLADFLQNKQTFATDLWAMGIALFEIFSPDKSLPVIFDETESYDELHEVLLYIIKNEKMFYDELFKKWHAKDDIENGLQQIIRKLLSVNPLNRGTAKELFNELNALYGRLLNTTEIFSKDITRMRRSVRSASI